MVNAAGFGSEAAPLPTETPPRDRTATPFPIRHLPPRFLGALAVALAFVVFLTFDQAHWWCLRPDYAFGWLVPILAIYVVADRLPRLIAILRAGGSSPLPRGLRFAVSALAFAGMLLGLFVFLVGAAYRAGDGPSQPGSLALAAGFTCILLGMVYWTWPDGALDSGDAPGLLAAVRRDARLRATALFLFPALVWMISAPLASAVENAISLFLLRRVVAVVFAIFSSLGLPLIQEGNVLVLPRGQVGVADACSGIRSLTGCLFAGSFLAAVFLDRFWKKALLVIAAMGLAFLTNLARSLFLTSW